MTDGDIALACASLLVDELARGGVDAVCISPGSRSAPLALAFARHGGIRVFVHLDERSGAFFALGRAKATGRAVAIVTTSGSAAANVLPAVVEASRARVPLIVLTADRPPELRDTGANQTIDQIKLYGSFVRWFCETGVPDARADAARAWRSFGARAVVASLGLPAGPVHLNCAFREPLVPSGVPVDLGADAGGRAEGAPWERVVSGVAVPSTHEIDEVARTMASTERGVIVAGTLPPGSDAVAELAARAGWPLLAEPMSGLRTPGRALSAGTALLGDEEFARAHRAEVVVQFGDAPTSRAAQRFVADAGRLIVVDPDGVHADPARAASLRVRTDAAALARALCARVPSGARAAWLQNWQLADAAARAAIDAFLDSFDEPFEPRVARDLAAMLPVGATLVVSSSMPVRDLDATMAPREDVRVLAGRGASGIDGFVSTALGIASAGTPTYALTGDLSMLHDASGLLWGSGDATFVVLNNNGGGIFDLLPQAALPEHETLFVTPHGMEFEGIASAARAAYTRVERALDLAAAVSGDTRGLRIVEVRIDRARAVARRSELRAAVARALATS